MPKTHVNRTQKINAPVEKVYAIVRDFRQWQPWSPWLIAEPGCEVTHAADGKSYAWDGQIIGAGSMEVLTEEKNKSITNNLTFLKPFKSQADVNFKFAEKDGGTEVAWTMDSSLPFFMFFMKGMMEAFIGIDYERGLMMLKEYAETGEVSCKLEFPGKQNFPGCDYVGIRKAIDMDDLEKEMGPDFQKVMEWAGSSGAELTGKPFSIYHKWNPVKKTTEYTVAFPLKEIPADLPDGMTGGAIPAAEVYAVKHTGPYRYLSNAWASGMMHARGKQFKQNKSIAPFEVYENDPSDVEEKELVTVVHFPAK